MTGASRLVVRVCLVGIAVWLLHIMLMLAGNALVARGYGEMTLLPLALLVSVVTPPILILLLVYAIARAVRDLLRSPELRSEVNIGITIVGSVALALGAWAWYIRIGRSLW